MRPAVATPAPNLARAAKGAGLNSRYVFLLSVTAVYYWLVCLVPTWSRFLGIAVPEVWFLDTRALLAASDAHVLGIDPSARNPLDLFFQPHVYSDWWFAFARFGLTRADSFWVGGTICLLFLAAALVQLKTRSNAEAIVASVAMTAPGIMLGVHRANADLLVFFLLAVTASLLNSRSALFRWIAMGGILLGLGLKFYPAIAGLALFSPGRSKRETAWQFAVFVVLAALLAFSEREALQRYLAVNDEPMGFHTFGARVTQQHFAPASWAGTAVPWVVGVIVGLVGWRTLPALNMSSADRSEHLRFVIGASLLVGCYFLTINYAYRFVFALFTVPFLWRMGNSAPAVPYLRRLSNVTLGLALLSLWYDGIVCIVLNILRLPQADIDAWSPRLFLAGQPFAAGMIAGLILFLAGFVRDSLRSFRGDPNPTLSTEVNSSVPSHL